MHISENITLFVLFVCLFFQQPYLMFVRMLFARIKVGVMRWMKKTKVMMTVIMCAYASTDGEAIIAQKVGKMRQTW